MHFFEVPDAQVFTFPGAPDPTRLERTARIPGHLQHIAFALPDEDSALALRQRLIQYGVQVTDITDFGNLRSMWFYDNNGILLEAAWPR